MITLDEIDKKLKCGEEDREEMRRKFMYYKKENLDNYFSLVIAIEEKLLQMAERLETKDTEREKFIKKNMEEMKKRGETEVKKLKGRN